MHVRAMEQRGLCDVGCVARVCVQARAHNVEKNKIQAEITAYKKTVEQLKRRTVRGCVCV